MAYSEIWGLFVLDKVPFPFSRFVNYFVFLKIIGEEMLLLFMKIIREAKLFKTRKQKLLFPRYEKEKLLR